jgi:hypothetical protein
MWLLVAVLSVCAEQASAQLIRAPLDTGFVRTSSIAMSVDEMLGSQKARPAGEPILGPGYPALWIAEVQYKPVRHLFMNVTDPVTRQTKRELVWYMIYRVIQRDYTELAGDSRDSLLTKLQNPDLKPDNATDSPEGSPLLVPRFVLRSDDAGEQHFYPDEVNLQIQRSVFMREFRGRSANLRLLNSVQAVTEVMAPVSVNDPDPLQNAVYGVAVWRNVDPKIDYLTIIMSGFSNAYRISQNDAGETIFEHKVIEQKFGRPGDIFNQQESEFRVLGNPTWRYRPRPAKVSVPQLESILRNVSSTAEGAPAE